MICAAHGNLTVIIEERQFRAVLFYRLSVVPAELPPLRKRPENIRLLYTTLHDRAGAIRRLGD
jgi:transcriptional regulator with GAF, ATPase, and Fis domain